MSVHYTYFIRGLYGIYIAIDKLTYVHSTESANLLDNIKAANPNIQQQHQLTKQEKIVLSCVLGISCGGGIL